MTDPSRLLDSASDEFERLLLGSALADRGSDAARARALAALGTLGVGLLASSSASAAGTALVAAPGSLATAVSPQVTLLMLAKWIGTGVVVGVLSAGGVQALVAPRVESPASPQVLASTSARAPARAAAAPSSRAPALVLPAAVASSSSFVRDKSSPPEEAAPVSASPEATSSSGAFPSEATGPRLGEELQALEQVRQALRRGDAAGSIAALSRYEARFPRGALAREATLLAVEAKLAAGDVAGARAVAARVLASDQSSPHAKKIQALLSARGMP